MGNTILSIQNTEIETLGTFSKLFESDGYGVVTVNALKDLIPLDATKYSAIVILGGYMSVYEDLSYLQREQQLIRNAKENEIPVLGICLGSQLIAQALGGSVYKGKKKEIGWFDIAINEVGTNDIFKGIDMKTIKVFQWHGDTYELPKSATLLASSELYPQAFRVGNIIGMLFHLEVDSEMIQKWTDAYEVEMRKEEITRYQILNKKEVEFETLAIYCNVVYSNFSKLIKRTHL
jgi:GMP synthase (glutamine-hydrolysing)